MTKFAKISTSLAATLLLTLSGSALADGAAVYLAKGCMACHGMDGKSPIMPAYPKIAGQSVEYITQQLKDIKSGDRSNGQSAAMKGIMASVTDEEIEQLAKYVSGM